MQFRERKSGTRGVKIDLRFVCGVLPFKFAMAATPGPGAKEEKVYICILT